MKAKLNNINSKLILLEIIIIITGLATALYTYTSIGKIKSNYDLLNTINTLKINLTNQNQEIYNLIENDQFNVSLYKNEKTPSISAFKNFQTLDSMLIRQLMENGIISKNTLLKERTNKIKDHLSEYNKKFDILLINLRDRGYESYGSMGRVYEKAREISVALSNADDYMLSELILQMNNKIKQVGKSFNADFAEELPNITSQIINQVYVISELNPNLDAGSLSLKVNELITEINSVISKHEVLGIDNNSGVFKQIKILSGDITSNLLELTEDLSADIPIQNKRNSNGVLILMMVITSILAIYIIYIIRSFIYPVILLNEYIDKLVEGALPEKPTLDTEDEFFEITSSLAKVVDGLKTKTEFASELGKGNLKTTFDRISDKDKLGNALLTLQKSLQRAAEEDIKHKTDNERRRWANEGLAKFSEILRMNNDNTEMLCDSVIKNLVKYLGASLGGVYLYNDENKDDLHLYLASTFAYDRKKFLEDKILLGEGLIGSCAQEKQTIYMTELPDDYIRITSGLGEENPRILLIVPLNLENDILGVLEIASFEKFEKHVLEFVESLAESIASTLASAKINERTQHLLEQSQKQAIEMAEQEEEMRQNMEELQATQEESSRKESEMFGILHAINSTTYYFETDMDGTILEMNERMLVLLEIQKDHVVGMHHSELTSMNKNSPEYISFWSELREGTPVTKIQKSESISGNEIWLKQNYTPIFDKTGKAVKVICISTDISETVQLEKDVQKVERELSATNNDFEHIKKTIDEGFVLCALNNEGYIINLNTNFEKLTGLATKELLEKKFQDLLSEDHQKSFERIWENIESGHPFNNIMKFISSDENKLVKIIIKPFLNDANKLVKAVLIGEVKNSNTEIN